MIGYLQCQAVKSFASLPMILGFFRNERGGFDGEILPAKHIPPVYILSLSLFLSSLSRTELYTSYTLSP
jgi:hypothetical protein